MWRYPGPSCPNRSFSAELADAEVDTQVRLGSLEGPGGFPCETGRPAPG
jgi:hypothetical protein